MGMVARVGGVWQDIAGASIRVGGAWQRIKAVKIYEGATWRTAAVFATTLDLSLSRSTLSRTGTNSTLTTGNVLATPTGGIGPFTYAWAKQSGGTISATASTNAQTAFRATNMAIDETRTAVFRCTCTDAFGSSDTADVSVTITRIEGGIIIGGNL